MRGLLGVLITVAVVFLLPMGCSDSNTGPEPRLPFENLSEEAKLVALCLSGELHPPYSLALQVEEDLAAIRAAYEEQYQMVKDIQFRPPWAPSCIMIGLDPESMQQFLDGEYTAWDDLNDEYGLIDINRLGTQDAVTLYFEGIVHPRHLSELYDDLPGVQWVELNALSEGGEHVYPRSADGSITYLFQAGGDFAQRPMEFCYFIFDGEAPTLIGSWEWPSGGDPPEWWEDAQQNIDLYKQF